MTEPRPPFHREIVPLAASALDAAFARYLRALGYEPSWLHSDLVTPGGEPGVGYLRGVGQYNVFYAVMSVTEDDSAQLFGVITIQPAGRYTLVQIGRPGPNLGYDLELLNSWRAALAWIQQHPDTPPPAAGLVA